MIMLGSRRSRVLGWAWFAPLLLLLSAVVLYPAVVVSWTSLHQMRFFQPVKFVGLANYLELVSSREFWTLTRNSFVYIFGSLIATIPLGFFSAMVIEALGAAGSTVRVILLIPWTLSQAVVGCIWLWLLNPSIGPIAYLFHLIGLEPGLLLGDTRYAMPLLIMITAWWSFPYAMVLMSAAVQGIPRELYEAMEIDGGGRMTAIRYVVWPHVAPTIAATTLTLSILYVMLVTLIIILTGGGPLGATATWSFVIFQNTVASVDISSAAVLSVILLITNLILGLSCHRRWRIRT